MSNLANSSTPSSADFDTLYNISPGMHFYQFYKGIDDYLRVLIPFFLAGLEKGQGCLWLASERMGLDEIYLAAENAIPNLTDYLASRQFQIRSAEDWYRTDGHFDEERAITNAMQYLKQMQKYGFVQFRVSGDAGSIPHRDWSKVVSYEKKVSSMIKSLPVIALCAYPIFQCTLTDTKAVLDEHDDVLISRI